MLERHFRDDHFLCEDADCLAKKFVVFRSKIDLIAHSAAEHTQGGSGQQRSQRQKMRQLDIEISYADSPGDERRRRPPTQQQSSRTRLQNPEYIPIAAPVPAPAETFSPLSVPTPARIPTPVSTPPPPPPSSIQQATVKNSLTNARSRFRNMPEQFGQFSSTNTHDSAPDSKGGGGGGGSSGGGKEVAEDTATATFCDTVMTRIGPQQIPYASPSRAVIRNLLKLFFQQQIDAEMLIEQLCEVLSKPGDHQPKVAVGETRAKLGNIVNQIILELRDETVSGAVLRAWKNCLAVASQFPSLTQAEVARRQGWSNGNGLDGALETAWDEQRPAAIKSSNSVVAIPSKGATAWSASAHGKSREQQLEEAFPSLPTKLKNPRRPMVGSDRLSSWTSTTNVIDDTTGGGSTSVGGGGGGGKKKGKAVLFRYG